MSNTYKNVALNTVILYTRTFLSMLITLYSSRILLEYIGITDFGIFSLVGGVVIMFGFFNNAMSAATQRFITIEKTEEKGGVNSIFNISLVIHVALSVLVLFFLETIGLWYLKNKINVPVDRLQSTLVLYQILSFNLLVSIINVPYNAILIAYEKMRIIALVGILESILKLIGILLIPFIEYDRLIIYSLILFVITIINRGIYIYYCRKEFKELIHINFILRRNKIKEMIVFAFWNLFGVVAAMGYNQGVNLILNIFFNVVVNAARGIAFQIYQSFYTIASNIQLSTNTFIINAYVKKDNYEEKIINIIKFLMALFLLIIIPFYNNTSDILTIWLGNNIPEGTEIFAKLLLIDLLINIISGPIHTLVQAEGNIKNYQVIISVLLLLNLPLSYFLLKFYKLPEITFIISIFLSVLAFLYRVYYIKKKFKFKVFRLLQNILKFSIIGVFIFYLVKFLHGDFNNIYINLLYNVPLALLITIIFLFLFGSSINEKKYIIKKIQLKLDK